MAARPVAEGDGGAPRAAWRAPRHHARRRRRGSSSRSPPRRTPAAFSGPGATRAAAIALDSAVKTRLRERGVEAAELQRPAHAGAVGGRKAGRRATRRLFRLLASPSRASVRCPSRRARLIASRPRPGPRALRSGSRSTRSPLRRSSPTGPASLRSARRRAKRARSPRSRRFIDGALAGYAEGRDLTSRETTSRLSAHLRFGEISPRRIAAAVENAAAARPALQRRLRKNSWPSSAGAISPRPSSMRIPIMATRPLRPEFERFPWRDDEPGFSRLGARARPAIRSSTPGCASSGAPDIMPNRVRMIAASFLVKHLLIDWRRGEAMVLGHAHRRRPRQQSDGLAVGRGVGRRRRPLFPHLQSGAAGGEVRPRRRLCPPLGSRACPARGARISMRPGGLRARRWRAAGVVLGKTYPQPIVDHAFARARALKAFACGDARRG